ncbi:MAG TPA: hypothetical protein DIV79_05955 [Opitutae bacterium]|nr:hypothetical protein [Opitutae bacterium]
MKLRPYLLGSIVAFAVVASGHSATASEILVDLAGNSVDPLAISNENAVVLVFTAVDCPISNRYIPAINRLFKEYASKNTSFWMVYPGSYFDTKEVESHLEEYRIKAPAIIDRSGYLVKKTGATVTPEVAVYPAGIGQPEDGNWIYRGRIDDRYTDFGKWRANPTREDLKEVLQSLVDGQTPERRETRSIGCYIAE